MRTGPNQYEKIYQLEAELKVIKDQQSRFEKRNEMRIYFEKMAITGTQMRSQYSDKSSLVRAIDYYLNNYKGLTQFLSDPDLPIDNNISERQLRSPVIGRKTWYGTHSDKGAKTTKILFTILLSCKLQRINPRDYLTALVQRMHAGGPVFTPS